MILGEYLIEDEEKNNEYKEFCFKFNVYEYLSKKEVRHIINTGILDNSFNDLIMLNIKMYISIYIPRYVCSFHNTKYSQNNILSIGVNDSKEITGIPYLGNLINESDHIHSLMVNELSKNVSNLCCNKFEININKCTIDTDIIESSYLNNMISNFNNSKHIYQAEYKKYVSYKKKWIKEIYYYKGKVENLINDKEMLHMFKQYMKNISKYETFRDIFENPEKINFDNIKDDKFDSESILFWLIQFKEKKAKKILQRKPIEPKMPKILSMEYCLITKLSSLREKFINSNKRLNYFTIDIKITNDISCRNNICFTDLRTGNWRKMMRFNKSDGGGPQCIDF
jgi:hypothetical protein